MKNYLKEYFKLLRFAHSHKSLLILAALCMGVSTIFEGISLGMIMPLSDRVLTNKKIIIPGDLPQFLSSAVDKLNSIEPFTFLKFMLILVPLLFLIKGIFFFFQEYLMNMVGQGVVKEVRSKLYAKFQDLSMDFYGAKRTGELMSRVTNDVAIITNAISYALKDLIFESMKAALFAFLAFYLGFMISWKLLLVVFVLFPLIMYPVIRLGKRIKKFALQVQQRMADLNSIMAETIQGAYIVKAFCREDYELGRFNDINHQYYRFTLKTAKRMLVLSPLTEFIGVCGAVVILGIVGREVISGNLSFGVFATFLVFVLQMIRPLKKLSNVYAINQQALVASSRIYDILDEKPKVRNKKNPLQLKEFKSKVSFDKVWFKYSDTDDFVLKDISLKVKKGETVALVGPSGAGKSTLVSLLVRFYDPQKGTVSVDAADIKKVDLKNLRSLVSIVSQEMVLFNTTIKENIAYGKEGALEEDIIEAAKKAHAYEFIKDFPDGFSTIIGDRGLRLSGGQKQRIAIARAILKDSPILILDEATSQLDSESEQLIRDAFDNLLKGKTAFIIAHRLSTVQQVDRIVVLDKGEIVEIGTHSQLLAKDGSIYKKLYEMQFDI